MELLPANQLWREGIRERCATIDTQGAQGQHGSYALFAIAAIVSFRVLPTHTQPFQRLRILNHYPQLIHAGFSAIVDDLDRFSGP